MEEEAKELNSDFAVPDNLEGVAASVDHFKLKATETHRLIVVEDTVVMN